MKGLDDAERRAANDDGERETYTAPCPGCGRDEVVPVGEDPSGCGQCDEEGW